MNILAHRGGMDRGPENTIAAFQRAFDDNADAFECDVCLTKDNEPVLIHTKFDDDDIQSVTGCSRPLRNLDWEEVRTLKVLNSAEPVAHLDEMLSFVQATKLPCFIEPKQSSEALIAIVIDRVRRFNLLDKVSLLTFSSHRELLLKAKKCEPKMQTSAIIINPMANFLEIAKTVSAERIIIGWSGLNHFRIHNFFVRSLRRKLDELRSHGIHIEAGFVKTQHDVNWLMRNEISGLWVDDVPKIKAFLSNIER